MEKRWRSWVAILLVVSILASVTVGCKSKTETLKPEETKEPTGETQGEVGKVGETTTPDGWVQVINQDGPTLGYHPESGVKLLEVEGQFFKDLNKSGDLDPYEDWRLSADERAKDLATKMEIDEIAGLMLYSAHTALESPQLAENHIQFLDEENVRAVLVTSVESKGTAAKWNNNAQAFVEASRLGIPINSSSDPRNSASSGEAYSSGAGDISMWPSNLGFAASFDPALMTSFGEIAAKEYRALGIGTALSPQIDIATEPRWLRANGTFGEDSKLATDLTKAYSDSFQTTGSGTDGWGYDSVNAMIKHWPGDGAGEKGRESHLYSGKYAVYPGDNFDEHLIPFTEGGFKLDGPTGMASAVMTSYSIAYDESGKYGEPVGSGFSAYKVQELLRDKYGYDGVVCTDWLIVGTEGITDDLTVEKDGLYQPSVNDLFGGWGISWGLEYNTKVVERFYEVIKSGHDQFGGVNTSKPVVAAYELGVADIGEEAMRARFEESAVRLLRNIFHLNLFENPYLDVAGSEAVVGSAEFMQAGYDAQLASVVMVKNKNNTIRTAEEGRKTVYVPQTYVEAVTTFDPAAGTNDVTEAAKIMPVLDIEAVERYFDVVTDEVAPSEEASLKDIIRRTDFQGVDFALLAIDSPNQGSMFDPVYLQYDKRNYDPSAGALDNGIYPISLQYRPYTAPSNEHTITTIATDPAEEAVWTAAGGAAGTSRSYAGKTTNTPNEYHLDLVLDTKTAIGDLPIVLFVRSESAFVMAEIEEAADAILLGFGVSDQAILEVISGQVEPKGLLPIQMPQNMDTVEANQEDVAKDLTPYTDSEGNSYDFAYGLNWTSVIADSRTEKYGATTESATETPVEEELAQAPVAA